MKFLNLIALLLFSLFSYGQKEELIKFLDAYKSAEFEESQEFIKKYSFKGEIKYTILDYNFIHGLTFDTDIPGKKAYKAVVAANVKMEKNGYAEKKMIIIMFWNKDKNTWCVFEFREACDPLKEYTKNKASVESGDFYTKKEYVYRNLAYWSLCAGKIADAKKHIDLAVKAAKDANNTEFTTNGMDDLINFL